MAWLDQPHMEHLIDLFLNLTFLKMRVTIWSHIDGGRVGQKVNMVVGWAWRW